MFQQVSRFILRWLIASLGLFLADRLLSQNFSLASHFLELLTAGLILAIVNVVLKPVLIILSLPAIMLTLGLFMIIINGLMVYLVSRFFPGLVIRDFSAAIFAGIVIGLLNYLVSTLLEKR